LSGGPVKKVEKRRKIIREERNRRLKSPVKINKNRRGKECFSGIF
jgi:hypothetical protein